MSVVMSMHWPEVTPEQYDAVRAAVRWEEDTPDGAVLHVAWFAQDGFRVVDVWDDQAAFEKFMAERLSAAIQQVGVQGQPEVQYTPLHRRFVAPGVAGAGD